MSRCAVVLAAGKGTRMASDLPKVLHPLGGRALVEHVVDTALRAGIDRVVVVVGFGAPAVRDCLRAAFGPQVQAGEIAFAEQAEQRGTGHAVLCAAPQLPRGPGHTLVLSGDVPLVQGTTLTRLLAVAPSHGLSLATFVPDDPTGYGRIVRDDAGRVVAIREQRDATAAEREIRECNAGMYAIALTRVHDDLPRVRADNTQGEVYLTDLVARVALDDEAVAVPIAAIEAAGVNTPAQLAELEAELARR